MKIIPKTLTFGFGALVLVGAASASTLTGSVDAFGSYSSFNAPNSSTTSASQFNVAAVNAAIQASCPVGFTCSALTLTEIDFTLTANLSATVTADNTNSATSYIGSIPGEGGTFGSPTSGLAVAQTTDVSLSDPLSNDLLDVVPTFQAATDTELKKNPSVCATGTPTPSNFLNCLAVAPGSQTYSGTGTDTETASYVGGSLTNAVVTAYEGTGVVTFGLSSAGSTASGSLQAGVTVPTNTATINGLSNGLEVVYDYSFTETSTSSTPEPGTMVLMGAALIGLGFIRRRKTSVN